MTNPGRESHRVERRSAARRNISFKVWSRELPGEWAQAVDLSDQGLQLQTSGPVEIGDPLMLWLEDDLKLRGRAVWCRESEPDGCLVGVRFERLEPEVRRRLELL